MQSVIHNLARRGFRLAVLLAGIWSLSAAFGVVMDVYHINRNMNVVDFDLPDEPSVFYIYTESLRLTEIMRGEPVTLITNEVKVIEKEAIAIGYSNTTAAAVWNTVVGALQEVRQYPGEIREHVGWVKGTQQDGDKWGAYLWVAQNQIKFISSATNWWKYTNGVPVMISNVLVGTLGDYPPQTTNVDVGPYLNGDVSPYFPAATNFLGAGYTEDKHYRVDITNVFYSLIIPSLWITPRDAYACVGGSNVEFTVVGTNIPSGVNWSLSPTNFEGHADFSSTTTNNAWVTPGSVATTYVLRATSVDNDNFYDETSLTIMKVDLKSVEFTSDHESNGANILKDNTNDWTDSGTAYVEPEWVKSPARNNPISHTKNAALTAKVTVKVEPSGVAFELIGDGSEEYVGFHKAGNTSAGGDQEITVTADASLPDEVCILNEDVDWSIKVGTDEFTVDSSGTHKIYVTYGTPSGSEVTEKRLSDVCDAASDQSAIDGCASAISSHLMSYQYSGQDNDGPSPIWLLHDGTNYTSLCPGLAIFINKHFQMLGLGEGAIKYCRAMPDGTYAAENDGNAYSRLCTPGNSGHPDPTTHDDISDHEWLYMIDGSGTPNNYEATCLFNSKYYAVGVGIYNTPKDVVMGAFGSTNNINWFYYITINSIDGCFITPWTEAP